MTTTETNNHTDVCETVSFLQLPSESFIYDWLDKIHTFYSVKELHTHISIVMCIIGTICNFCNIVVLTRLAFFPFFPSHTVSSRFNFFFPKYCSLICFCFFFFVFWERNSLQWNLKIKKFFMKWNTIIFLIVVA